MAQVARRGKIVVRALYVDMVAPFRDILTDNQSTISVSVVQGPGDIDALSRRIAKPRRIVSEVQGQSSCLACRDELPDEGGFTPSLVSFCSCDRSNA
jgi:hypothetical protein